MNGLATLSLCTGGGGLERGVQLAVPGAITRVIVERETAALEILLARMQEGKMEAAPIWDDVRSFDGRPWRGIVDLVTAGYPCQPESTAGPRRGVEDERWLWNDIARIIEEVEPAFCFFENVAAHVGGTFDRVLQGLASLGFDAEWECLTAASVGAPHRRNRLFILAAHPQRAELWLQSGRTEAGRPGEALSLSPRNEALSLSTPTATDWKRSEAAGYSTESGRHDGTTLTDALVRGVLTDAQREGLEDEQLESDRDERETAERSGDRWASRPAPEPTLRGVDDGLAGRLDRSLEGDRLFVLGNGVVPLQAARAWEILWSRYTT